MRSWVNKKPSQNRCLLASGIFPSDTLPRSFRFPSEKFREHVAVRPGLHVGRPDGKRWQADRPAAGPVSWQAGRPASRQAENLGQHASKNNAKHGSWKTRMFPSDDSFRSLPIPSVYTMKMRSLKIPSVNPSDPFRVHHFSFREQITSKTNLPRLFRNMTILSLAADKGFILRAHIYNIIYTTYI